VSGTYELFKSGHVLAWAHLSTIVNVCSRIAWSGLTAALKYLVSRVDWDDLDRVEQLWRHLLMVALVQARDHDPPDAVPMRGQGD